jgi:protocatechuate 3,4-dioxygenase beta subunit
MRSIVRVVIALGAVVAAAGAWAEVRVTGAVLTEKPVESVSLRAWAIGPRLVADPARADRPLAEATGRPGAELALQLPDGALPVRVEAVAAGHVAAALDVVLPGQAALPAIWLPVGDELAVRLEAGGRPAVGGRVWGSLASPEDERLVVGWVPVVPLTTADGRGEARVRVPASGAVELVGRDAQGHWGRRQERLGKVREATVRLTSRPLVVVARDGRGEPVAGVAVAASTAPAGAAALTDTLGRATVQVPAEGGWALVAHGVAGSARAVRPGAVKGDVVLTVTATPELEVAWTGTPGPVVLDPAWLPEALGGDAPIVAAGERARLPFLAPGGELAAWAPGATTGPVEVADAARAVALRFVPALRIEGTLADEGGGAVAGAPVWRWAPPVWMRRVRSTGGMPAMLDRPLLPAAVSTTGGGFAIADVPAGAFRLTARKAGLPEADSGPLKGTAGTTERVALQFVRGTWLALRTEDAAGRALAGVKVEVIRVDAPRPGGNRVVRIGVGEAGPEPVAVGTTDHEGRLTLAALPPGGVSVRLALPGYVPRETPATLPAEGLDLGLQVLEPGVTVSGRVLDERGQGVADAELRAAATPVRFLGSRLGTSDAQGHFVIADQPRTGELLLEASGERVVSAGPTKVALPPAGPVEVRVRQARVLEGRVVDERDAEPVVGAAVMASRRTQRTTGGMAFSMMRQVDSAESDERGVFRLDSLEPGEVSVTVDAPGFKTADRQVVVPEEGAAEAITVVLKPGLAIHGRVEDTGGTPAAGLTVEATPATSGSGVGMGRGGGGSARTDPEGAFVLDGLEAGRYELTAADETGAMARSIAAAGGDDEVVLRLEAPGRLDARVVDEAGAPIAGADVGAYGSASMAGGDQKTTDAAGAATFESLPPQRYRVSASAEGLARDLEEATVAPGQTAEVTLTLKRGGTIDGRIVGLSTEDLGRCMVRGGGTGDQPKPDGSFVLHGVQPGAVEVTASVFPAGRQRSVRTEVTDIEVPVSVEIDFTTGLTVRGTVRRASRPAAGLTVSAGGRGGRVAGSAVTDADGAYEIAGLDPGELEVRAVDEVGRTLAARTVQARADTRVDLVVPAGALAGRVVDARRREGIAGARVRATSEEPPLVDRSAQTGEDGAFRLAELADGAWALRVEASGYAPGEATARLSMGRASDVEVALEPEQRLDLILREPDGAVPDTAMLLPMRDGRVDDAIWLRCDRDGRATVTTLPPGGYTLLVIGRGAALLRVTVPSVEVPVQLQPGGRLVVMPPVESGGGNWRVRVVAGGGVAVPVSPWANPGRSEWITPGGNPLTLRLPAGGYVVEAIAPAGTTQQHETTVPPEDTVTLLLE